MISDLNLFLTSTFGFKLIHVAIAISWILTCSAYSLLMSISFDAATFTPESDPSSALFRWNFTDIKYNVLLHCNFVSFSAEVNGQVISLFHLSTGLTFRASNSPWVQPWISFILLLPGCTILIFHFIFFPRHNHFVFLILVVSKIMQLREFKCILKLCSGTSCFDKLTRISERK